MHLFRGSSSALIGTNSLRQISLLSSSVLGLSRIRRNLTTTTPFSLEHPNPGNFANRTKKQMKEIGRKGGQKGGKARGVGGFHNMDPEKQHEIASKGGQASSGKFTKGSKRAREAGRRGGQAVNKSWNFYEEE